MVSHNPLRADPTRTRTIRDKFERVIRMRFRIFQRALFDLVVTKDVFGLGRSERNFEKIFGATPSPGLLRLPENAGISTLEPNIFQSGSHSNEWTVHRVGENPTSLFINVGRKEWAFLSDELKLKEFESWIATETGLTIVPESDRFWKEFVQDGYEKGAGRAWTDSTAQARAAASTTVEARAFAQGNKEGFLKLMLGAPETVEKVQLLASRVFTDLKGVNEFMATRIRRELVDGLVQGQNPRTIARNMSNSLGIARKRAEVIARTEIIRAHAEGQLDALERMGVTEVGVAVEWSTAGDTRVCQLCESLNGLVLKVKESHGLIPRHPQCVIADMRVCAPDLRMMMQTLYSGEIFDFVLSNGSRVSFTSHHIILTQRGWVFAKDITDRDYFINSPRNVSLRIPDKYLGEPCIADLYNAFVELSNPLLVTKSLSMPKDLHGDGKFCNPEINIVDVDGVLRNKDNTQSFGDFEKLLLNSGNISSIDSLFLSGDCSLSKFFYRASTTTDSLMSRFGITDVLFSRSSGHHESISFDLVSNANFSSSQNPIHGSSVQTQILRDTKTGDPRRVEFDNLIGGKLVKIESVSTRHVVSFPVYDVTTGSSLYSVNGFVTSNCRCAFVPANVGESKVGQVRPKSSIDKQIDESLKREGGKKRTLKQAKARSTWPGKSIKVTKGRPKSVLDRKTPIKRKKTGGKI